MYHLNRDLFNFVVNQTHAASKFVLEFLTRLHLSSQRNSFIMMEIRGIGENQLNLDFIVFMGYKQIINAMTLNFEYSLTVTKFTISNLLAMVTVR